MRVCRCAGGNAGGMQTGQLDRCPLADGSAGLATASWPSGCGHVLCGDGTCMPRQFDQRQCPLHCQTGPLGQRLAVHAVVQEVPVGRVDAQRQGACLEKN